MYRKSSDREIGEWSLAQYFHTFFWHETLFNFPRALPGLFLLQKNFDNIKKKQKYQYTRIMLYGLMLCIITIRLELLFNTQILTILTRIAEFAGKFS